MLCPNQDRTRLLTEQIKNLEEWLYKDEKTEPDLAYWIPKYTNEGHHTIRYNGGNVCHDASQCRESRQDRVETVHGRVHIQRIPQKTKVKTGQNS